MNFEFRNFFEKRPNIIVGLGVALTIIFIWLPFGFSLTGLIEEWTVLGIFTTHKLFFIAKPQGMMGLHAMRPLTIFPHALAYYLDPNSFDMWHWLLIISLCIKGWAAAWLVRYATRSNVWGLIAGILMLIYPADTMQLSFRAMHINYSISVFLAACVLWLRAFENKKQGLSLLLTTLASFLFLLSLFLYETVFPLFILPILILYSRFNLSFLFVLLRKKKIQILIWCFTLVVWMMYAKWISQQIYSYQAGFIHQEWNTHLIKKIPSFIALALERGVMMGWWDAFRSLFLEFGKMGYSYLSIFAASILGACYFSFRFEIKFGKELISLGNEKKLLMTGILLLILGFSPFLLAPSHVFITQRVYLCASFGGVLVWIAVFKSLQKYAPRPFFCFFGLFLMAGLSFQLTQFRHYVDISNRQKNVLSEIFKQFDGELENKKILVIDKTEQLNQTWFFLMSTLNEALTYFYGHSIHIFSVCSVPSGIWINEEGLVTGRCEENRGAWIFHNKKGDEIIDKKNLKIILIEPEKFGGKAEGINVSRDKKNVDFEKKYKAILLHPSWLKSFSTIWRAHTDQYYFSPGKYWNMDIPIRGSGWSDIQWRAFYSLSPEALIWQAQPRARLQFYFIPKKEGSYQILGHANFQPNSSSLTFETIFLNGSPLSLVWDHGIWQANLSETILKTGWNEIVFVDPYFPSGKRFGLRDFKIHFLNRP